MPVGPGAATLRRQQCIQKGLEGEGGLGVGQRGNEEVEDLVCERGCQALLREGRQHLLPTKGNARFLIKSQHAAHKIQGKTNRGLMPNQPATFLKAKPSRSTGPPGGLHAGSPCSGNAVTTLHLWQLPESGNITRSSEWSIHIRVQARQKQHIVLSTESH